MIIIAEVSELTRKIKLPTDRVLSVNGDYQVDGIAFKLPATYEGDFDFSTAAARVHWTGVDKVEHTNLLTEEDENGYPLWIMPSELTQGGHGVIEFAVSFVATDATAAITKRWISDPVSFRNRRTVNGSNEDEEAEEETTYDRLAGLVTTLTATAATINDVKAVISRITNSSPVVVAAVADLSGLDTTKYQFAYVRADGYLYCYDGAAWQQGIKYGSYELDTTLKESGKAADAAAVGAKVSAIKEDLSAVFNDKIGSIILSEYTNKSALKVGAIDSTGNVTTAANYAETSRYFDYMDLDVNATHIKAIATQATPTNFYVYVNFYDADKNFLSRSGSGGRPYITIANVPINARYIRVSFTNITNSTLGDNGISVGVTQYIQKGIYSGKKLYIVGDSISAGYVSMFKSDAEEKGLYIQYTAPVENDGKAVVSVWYRSSTSGALSYWGYANEVWGMNITNLSAPGKGYLKVSSTDSKNGVEVIKDTTFDDADVIIIALGFNDWHYQIARGTHDLIDANVPYPTEGYDTTLLTTYNQAIWYTIGEILRKAPNARLVVQTPMNGWAYGGDFSTNWGINHSLENSGTLADVHDDIVYWCNYYGVQCLDMTYNNSVVNRVNIKQAIIDGSHPSKAAHEALGLYVSGLL